LTPIPEDDGDDNDTPIIIEPDHQGDSGGGPVGLTEIISASDMRRSVLSIIEAHAE